MTERLLSFMTNVMDSSLSLDCALLEQSSLK